MAKLAVLTAAQEERVRNLLGRAKGRFGSAERASKRTSAQSGDYDNGFDGVVTGIYHILSAFELATTGRARSYGEADAPTAITHTVASLRAAGVHAPTAKELTELNADRNTSVHGGLPASPFDTDRVLDAVDTARYFMGAVEQYLRQSGMNL